VLGAAGLLSLSGGASAETSLGAFGGLAGIKNEQEINDLWAYLNQFDAEGNIKK
jgi:hypothetical protein